MTSIKTIFAAASLSAGLFATAEAADMKPLQGVSFHVGSKHAVVYFLNEGGSRKIVITSADDANFAPARAEKAITNGASVTFTCRSHGKAMNVNSVETTAAN